MILPLVLVAAVAGDALADLRASLAPLAATTPVRGVFEVASTDNVPDSDQPQQGKASAGFEISDAGLRILYPRPTLVEANQEARAEAVDPNRQTPARNGVQRIHALDLVDLLDAAAALSIQLQSAQLIEANPAARLVRFKITPKMSMGESKHVKKIDATLSVWLGADGVPLRAERSFYVKVSFFVISFESNKNETFVYARVGDRLVATRHEQTEKAGGFGEQSTSHTVETVRLEP